MHGVLSNISIAGFKIASLKSRQLRQKMHQYPALETITITLQSFQYIIMAWGEKVVANSLALA